MKKVSVSEAFDMFKPEKCVFVISIDEKGKPSGMICGHAMKCSKKSELYAVALWEEGYTQELIRSSKEFVVAVSNKSLEKEVILFGSVSGRDVDKFKESKIATEKAQFIKSPLLKDATINFECKLQEEVRVGDHIMFIGKILAAYVNEDKKVLLNMGKINGERIYKEF
ncbi:MAG: flavin reductase family protein [Candidatus Paceibacterota bacterium]|jgi:flavin reductase (DIM6/NTAB) family NADH-FMN oxidoreductase RutF